MKEKLLKNIISAYNPEYESVPEKSKLIDWIEDLLALLFPLKKPKEEEISENIDRSKIQFKNLLLVAKKAEQEAQWQTDKFYMELPEILEKLKMDANKFLNSDPAAKCMGEILHTYPGFCAICIYRVAHALHHKLELLYVPRMLSEYAHSKTGIDIHPGAKIGASFMIDHGTGVVIGETCEIGRNVSVYQGVTLGALQVDKKLQGEKRHPTIGDNVVIYANATVLGGDTVVGNNSIIGGNVFLTKSVNPFSTVFIKPEIKIKNRIKDNDVINFVI